LFCVEPILRPVAPHGKRAFSRPSRPARQGQALPPPLPRCACRWSGRCVAAVAGAGKFDFIISTVSAKFDLSAYINLLAMDGTLGLVGAPAGSQALLYVHLIQIGSVGELQRQVVRTEEASHGLLRVVGSHALQRWYGFSYPCYEDELGAARHHGTLWVYSHHTNDCHV
jgi:hypothetical protein